MPVAGDGHSCAAGLGNDQLLGLADDPNTAIRVPVSRSSVTLDEHPGLVGLDPDAVERRVGWVSLLFPHGAKKTPSSPSGVRRSMLSSPTKYDGASAVASNQSWTVTVATSEGPDA